MKTQIIPFIWEVWLFNFYFSLLSLNFWIELRVSRECAESPLTPLALDSNQAPDMIVQTTWSSHPPDLELTLDCQKFYRSGQLIITQGPRLGPLLFSGSDWGLRLLHDCGWWPWGIKFVYSGPSMGLELARPQLVMMWCNTEWPAQASWAKAGRAWPWPSLQARRSQVPESEPDFKVTVSPVWHGGPGHKNNTRRYPKMSSDTYIPALFSALYPTGGSKSSKLAHIIFTAKFETLQAKSWRDTHIRNSSYLSSNLVISGQWSCNKQGSLL